MGELREKSLRIAEHFFAEVDLSKTRLLHVFISIKRFYEVDTSLIVRELWSRFPGITVVAPRIDKTKAEIDSVNFRTYSELIENAWGICEPSGLELADPSEMDLVIVPLLCFDELGNRVGYGKGYYDRFLARCRPDCLKVGLSHFPPAPLIDGITNSDVPLDICITPERSYRFGPALEHLN